MSDALPPMLEYRDSSSPAFKPFAATGVRFAAGMLLAAVGLWLCLTAAGISIVVGHWLVFPLIFTSCIFSFRAVWALRNFSGAALVERRPLLSIASGSAAFSVPAVVCQFLPASTIFRPIPVLLLLLLPAATAAVACWTAFRRGTGCAESGSAEVLI